MRLGPNHGQPQQRLDFGEYLDGLYGYAIVLSGNSTEAEALVQETCLRALRAIDRLHADGSVKCWLFTILRNIWLNQLRQRRTAPDLVELDADANGASEPTDAGQDPPTGYMNRIEREQVRAAIQQLPVEFREIIILREYEELSYGEIAALLDCPQGTVMSRLARARSKLRDLLSVGPMALRVEQNEVTRARNAPRSSAAHPNSSTPMVRTERDAEAERASTAESLRRLPNELQKTLVSAKAIQQKKDPQQTLAQIRTRQQAIDFFQR